MDFSWYLDPITKHYFDFQGVVSRQAFWMFVLYNIIVCIIISIVFSIVHLRSLTGLYSLALLFPTLGLEVRRLHDTGKSGWWVLVALVPLIGWIFLIYLFAQPSKVPYPG